MTGLCLGVGAVVLSALPVEAFTLAWTHSIEKIRWEEDYRVGAAGLRLAEARVRGTGAGMEPPAGALLREGVWHYTPGLGAIARLSLARSGAVADYELCVAGVCRPLAGYLDRPDNTPVVDLFACEIERH